MIRKRHPKRLGKRAIYKALLKNIGPIKHVQDQDFRDLVREVEENPRETADMLQCLCRHLS